MEPERLTLTPKHQAIRDEVDALGEKALADFRTGQHDHGSYRREASEVVGRYLTGIANWPKADADTDKAALRNLLHIEGDRQRAVKGVYQAAIDRLDLAAEVLTARPVRGTPPKPHDDS